MIHTYTPGRPFFSHSALQMGPRGFFFTGKMPHRIMVMNKTAPRKLQRSCLSCCANAAPPSAERSRFCHPTKPDHLQLTCARLYSIEDTCALIIQFTPAASHLCSRRQESHVEFEAPIVCREGNAAFRRNHQVDALKWFVKFK